MVEFHSLENPPLGKAEQLNKELSEHPELKPRLTFMFPVSERRRKILGWLKEEGTPTEEEIVDAMEDEDFIVREAGLRLLDKNPRLSKENLPALDRFLDNELLIEQKVKDEAIAIKVKVFMNSLSPDESLLAIQKMVKNGNFIAKATIARELANFKDGLPILEELTKISDNYVRRLAAESKIKIITENYSKKEALSIAEQMSGSGDRMIQGAGIKGLMGFEEALPLINEFSERGEESIRETLARKLADFKNSKEAVPILERLEQDKYKMVRESAVLSKVKIIIRDYPREEALSALEKIIQNNENLKEKIAEGMAGFKYGLPILEKLSGDENCFVRREVAGVLFNFGKEALPILEKLSKDEDEMVSEVALMVKYDIEAKSEENYDYLLATKKPLFATPFTGELAERILKLQEITEKLKKKFGEKFIGLIVFGSTAKGYFMPESDLDFGIIAKDVQVRDYFTLLAELHSLGPCMEDYIEAKDGHKTAGDIMDLYHGLFFGNRKELLKIQEKTLKDLDEKQWDSMRREILEEQIRINKAGKRFPIKEEKLEKIKQFLALLTVPPPREEALKIIQRRLKRSER